MFRQEPNTIDQINFAGMTIDKDQKRFPENLSGLLFEAVDARQYFILRNLCQTIENNHSDHIAPDRIIGQICYAAFAAAYTENEFTKLLDTLKIDPNYSATYAEYSHTTKQSSLTTAPLTHLALHFASKNIFTALIKLGANPENKDDKDKTVSEYLSDKIRHLSLNPGTDITQAKLENLKVMQNELPVLINEFKTTHSPKA